MRSAWRASLSPTRHASTAPLRSHPRNGTQQAPQAVFLSMPGGELVEGELQSSASPVRDSSFTNSTRTANDTAYEVSFNSYNDFGPGPGSSARPRSAETLARTAATSDAENAGISRALERALAAEVSQQRRRDQSLLAEHLQAEREREAERLERREGRERVDRPGSAPSANVWLSTGPLFGFGGAAVDPVVAEELEREIFRNEARETREGRRERSSNTTSGTGAYDAWRAAPPRLQRLRPRRHASLYRHSYCSPVATPPPSYPIAMLDRAPAYPFPAAPYNPYEDQGLDLSSIPSLGDPVPYSVSEARARADAAGDGQQQPLPMSVQNGLVQEAREREATAPRGIRAFGRGRNSAESPRGQGHSPPEPVTGIPLGVHDQPRTHHPAEGHSNEGDNGRRKRRSWKWRKHKRNHTVGSVVETMLSATTM